MTKSDQPVLSGEKPSGEKPSRKKPADKSFATNANTTASDTKPAYHHGDLRRCLLNAADTMIREQGIAGITLRKLADKVGVSRTALYHHFADKHELLCALAEEGFQRSAAQARNSEQENLSPEERFIRHVHNYVLFAVENPEYYDLMYGHDIWKTGKPTESLKKEAHASFRRYVQAIRQWQDEGVISLDYEALRFAQVSWSTLHGISRLLIDGIYEDTKAMEDMCRTAARVLLHQHSITPS